MSDAFEITLRNVKLTYNHHKEAEKNRERQKRHYDKVKNLTLMKHKNEGGMIGRNGAE